MRTQEKYLHFGRIQLFPSQNGGRISLLLALTLPLQLGFSSKPNPPSVQPSSAPAPVEKTAPAPSSTVAQELTPPAASTHPIAEPSLTQQKTPVAPQSSPTPTAQTTALPQGSVSETKLPVNPEIPEVLVKVENRYQTGKTLRAQFEQKEFIASTGRIKTTQGAIEIKRPNKIRWETRAPDPSLLVSDGKKFWFYTPPFDEGERGQIIEKKASQVQSKLAQTLISGSFSLARDLKIETIDLTHYRLVPKKGTAGTVHAAEIRVDVQKHEITEVKLEHRGGNRSEIRLSQIAIGGALPDELFQFIVPPNTDRMETEAGAQ